MAESQYSAQDIKAMAATTKLISKLTKHIWPAYLEFKAQHGDSDVDCDQRISSGMKALCAMLMHGVQKPSTHGAAVTHKIRIFLVTAIDSMYQLWDEQFLVDSFGAFVAMYRVIDDACDANGEKAATDSAEQQNVHTIRSSCLAIWSRMLRYKDFVRRIVDYFAVANSLNEAIGVLQLLLQTNERAVLSRLSAAVLQMMLEHQSA